ncbi:hypothetical protein [Palaeococcus sp. (in: euryarchaeotes)]
MRSLYGLKTLYGALIFSSLFLQAEYFGAWSTIKTIVSSVVAFTFITVICWAGRRLNSGNCRDRTIKYDIGYTKLSGARGKSKQLYALFVAYFGIGGIFNLPLMFDSTGIFPDDVPAYDRADGDYTSLGRERMPGLAQSWLR